jgi:hypothetical protein
MLLGPTSVPAQDVSSQKGWVPEILEDREDSSSGGRASSSDASPYLPDYSYAGYRWGEEPLPEPSGTEIRVTEYGATPDDGKDDTEAIQRALREAHQKDGAVVVRLPPGRLIVKEILFLKRSNVVLKGDEQQRTQLYFPRPLSKMTTPEGYDDPLDREFSPFSWRGGVIWTRDPDSPERRELGRLVAGRRGFHTLRSQRPLSLKPGDVVQIRWRNREGKNSSLLAHIYCTSSVQFGTNLFEGQDPVVATQEVTVEEVQGRTVEIKEPLLHDLREKWRATLHTSHFLEEVGIENLRITFPEDVEYGGHHQEAGYNGIYLTDLKHSWVRDVTVENADSGLLSAHAKNITVKEIVAGTGRWGHYSVHVGDVYGMLVEDFEFYPTLHNPSFNTKSRASVYTDGFILSPVLDQHMGINHQNLFDNLRTQYNGPDDRLFSVGGSNTRWGPVAGAFNTFWNIQVDIRNATESPVKMTSIQEYGGAPHARIVGIYGDGTPIDFEYGPAAYIEGKNRPGIEVESLYDYQLDRRLSGETAASLAIYDPLDGDGFKRGETVSVRAEIRGNFEADEVRFFADGDLIGADSEGDRRWSVDWSSPESGSHSITAIAEDSDGNTLASRPLSCKGEPVRIWLGDEDDLLRGNVPNPFRNYTTIEYILPETRHVRLNVFDVLGRRVRTLVDEVQSSGRRTERLNASELSSGTYFYRLETGTYSEAGKAVLVR